MPPREASNLFPDQYLTLDYDASSPGIPHDTTPGVNGGGVGMGGIEGAVTTQEEPFDAQGHNLQNGTNTAQDVGGNSFNPVPVETENGSAAGDNLNNPSHISHSGASQVTSSSSTSRLVDPLSIDPTSSDPNILAQFSAASDDPSANSSTIFSLRRRFADENRPPPPHTVSPPPLAESNVSVETYDFFSTSDGSRSYPRASVLDQALSDEDDDSIPDLDMTADSAASAVTASPSDDSSFSFTHYESSSQGNHPASQTISGTETSPLALTFSSTTTVSDLKYFAERGCIVPLLSALHTPRLKTLGCRMLADYAKMANRRVAVASNKKILEFVLACMTQPSLRDWIGREYAVETIRSLTATEESDVHLMTQPYMLETLALAARGGPFWETSSAGLASPRGRLHACIAIMNLSCGKSNKIEIAKCLAVLETMRDVMLCTTGSNAHEARLKATTCVKNLSNADANDSALLECTGLVEALGTVARTTPSSPTTTTNACLALMNLSISKANKHRVFCTPGVMDALIYVINMEEGSTNEAKIKACSALSNLAIGYDNKIPMFQYPGFVDSILNVIKEDVGGEARTKACSILWSFAAEMKNQVPVVQRGDILPILVQVAEEDTVTEARFKCVAALTLLAESLDNAMPLLHSGALNPLMNILNEAGPDPTQWKGQTASWCVGFLMNLSQSDDAVPLLRDAGVVELLQPLLTLNHYQSLKAAMAVTFVCRYDEDDATYDLLRKTETVIPKIISLLHNTLDGRGGNGYKYGVFTLRSSVGCIASLASGPDFMKERIATEPVYGSLLQVMTDFCVDGGTPGAIVGGGRDDVISATLAIRALHGLTGHLIPIPGKTNLPFEPPMEDNLVTALESFENSSQKDLAQKDRMLAREIRHMILGYELQESATDEELDMVAQQNLGMKVNCCGFPIGVGHTLSSSPPITAIQSRHLSAIVQSSPEPGHSEIELIRMEDGDDDAHSHEGYVEESPTQQVRTFLLADGRGRRFAVPIDPSGGRVFNDNRAWCYRRGRFCRRGELPDPNFRWTTELQRVYMSAVLGHKESSSQTGNTSPASKMKNEVSRK